MNNNILNFMGFDSIQHATKGGTGVDAGDPTRASYEGTPHAQELTVTYGLTWAAPSDTNFQYNNAGVSNMAAFRVAALAENSRRAFIFGAGRYSAPASPTVQILTATGRNNSGVAGKPWGYRFGFYLTDLTVFPSTPTSSNIANVTMMLGGNLTPIITRTYVGGRSYWAIPGVAAANCPTIVLGEPTHFEVELSSNTEASSTNMVVTLKIWVNGDLMYSGSAYTVPQTSSYAVRLRFNINGTNQTWMNRFGFSDMVISRVYDDDGVFYPNLGPQLVKRASVTIADPANWTSVNVGAVSAALNNYADTNWAVSPDTKAPLDMQVDLGLPAGVELNAINVYLRAQRDIAASVPMTMSMEASRVGDGVSLGGERNVPVGSQPAFSRVLSAGTVGSNVPLDFADSGKIALRLKVS